MKLYSYWRSSCSYRVRIALELKGLAYGIVPVNLMRDGGEQHAPAYVSLNPAAKVPSLELDDGRVLTESLAIIEYLEEVHPTPALLPKDPFARATVRRYAEAINAGIQPMQNSGVLKDLANFYGVDGAEWSRHVMGKGLLALEKACQATAGTYLLGGEVTMADVCLIPQMYNARRYQVPLDQLPTLVRIDAACAELPAFAAAHPDRQPDAPEP